MKKDLLMEITVKENKIGILKNNQRIIELQKLQNEINDLVQIK